MSHTDPPTNPQRRLPANVVTALAALLDNRPDLEPAADSALREVRRGATEGGVMYQRPDPFRAERDDFDRGFRRTVIVTMVISALASLVLVALLVWAIIELVQWVTTK